MAFANDDRRNVDALFVVVGKNPHTSRKRSIGARNEGEDNTRSVWLSLCYRGLFTTPSTSLAVGGKTHCAFSIGQFSLTLLDGTRGTRADSPGCTADEDNRLRVSEVR